MTSGPASQVLFLGAEAQMQCGVGQFTQLLAETIERLDPGATTTLTLTRKDGTLAEIWRAAGSAQNVVCNFPIAAWKRLIITPLLALAIARLRGRRVILLQHEWRTLHWLRRLTYLPALLLADTIVMFSPRRCRPTSKRPPASPQSHLYHRLARARAAGQLVIGHFGLVYPGKQPSALLGVGTILAERGESPLIVYIGSFIRGMDRVEEKFYARAAELGIRDSVIVSGYVASDYEAFGLFSEVDAFCYPLDEGLTARRSNILACVQSARPVIVAAADEDDEFDHHPRFRTLIEHGAITLVARGADEAAYAEAIMTVLDRPPVHMPFDFDGWWDDVARAVRAQFAVMPSGEPAPDSAGQTPPART